MKAILQGGEIPPDLVITYDDLHGLWGGLEIIIRGRGCGERREWAQGAAAPQVSETAIPQGKLLELIKLLIEHEAWAQQTPDRMPVPDESRATLTISASGATSTIWEWVNDMAGNARLLQIKLKMSELIR
ncbi:MAG: hypothetical protein ACJ74W_24185 [Pyrinomonadaceae bacterium]